MLSKWPKVVCDPVHSLITFEDIPCDKLLLSLINTKEFQRLRRIKQLGMSDLVFPGANHSRFAHSIGVMHMARAFLDRLAKVSAEPPTTEQRTVVLVAALLHDIGHGPFSHAFEKVTDQNHEKWTEAVIRDPSTEVNRCLVEYDGELPGKILMFFDSDVDDSRREAQGIPAYLTQIVSSQLDADRFDYLLRDSYASGTSTGQFEYAYIIQNLFLDEEYGRLVVGRKALLAAEAYVFARYRMYQTVYFHKTTRAAEIMLKLLLLRFKELLKEHGVKIVKARIVKDAPPRMYAAFAGAIGLDDYLAMDDSTVSEFFKCAAVSSDQALKTLAEGILNRRLYKVKDITGMHYHVRRKFTSQVESEMRAGGFSPEYEFVGDTATDTPYKPYDPSASKPSKEIYVETIRGDIEEITSQSAPLTQLLQKYTLVRYYFPEGARSIVERIAEQTH